MADDGPQMDQGALNFARGIGQGQPADTNKPATSMQEFLDQLIEQTGNWFSKVTGVKISSFFTTGMFGGTKLEDGGIKTGNSIVSAAIAQGTNGGVLAGISSVFSWFRDSTISAPPIEVASGGDSGSNGGSGDSGGGGGGATGDSGGHGFESYATSSGMADMFIAAGGGNNFEPRSVSESILGTISPPNIGDASYGRGEGFSMNA